MELFYLGAKSTNGENAGFLMGDRIVASTKKVKILKNHKKSNKFDEKKIFLKKIFFDPFLVILVIFGIFWGSKIPKKIENFFLTGIDPEWSEMHFKPKISIF